MTTPPEIHSVRAESSRSTGNPPSRRTSDTIRRMALFAGLLFSGLFAGFLLAVLILEASLRRFPASVYTQVRQVELAHLDDLATVLLPAALLATATLVVVTIARPGRTRWLALTALVLLLATFIISMLVSVPINTDQQGWSVLAPPSDWAARARPLADRSSRAHHHRRVRVHHPCGGGHHASTTRRQKGPGRRHRNGSHQARTNAAGGIMNWARPHGVAPGGHGVWGQAPCRRHIIGLDHH